MIVVTVFLSFLNQMEFHLVQNNGKLYPRSHSIHFARRKTFNSIIIHSNLEQMEIYFFLSVWHLNYYFTFLWVEVEGYRGHIWNVIYQCTSNGITETKWGTNWWQQVGGEGPIKAELRVHLEPLDTIVIFFSVLSFFLLVFLMHWVFF